MSGSFQLTLKVTDVVSFEGPRIRYSSDYEVKAKGEGSSTAKKVAGGAGVGALIGGIAGEGAPIGVASGGDLEREWLLRSPSETLLEFRLQQPAALPVSQVRALATEHQFST